MTLSQFMAALFFLHPAIAASTPKSPLSLAELRKGSLFHSLELAKKTAGPGYFWVCEKNPKKTLRTYCEDLGLHETEGSKAMLVVELKTKSSKHGYGLRHAIPTKECHGYIHGIQKIKKSNAPFCIYGALIGQISDAPELAWVFFEMKTKSQRVVEFEFEPGIN